REWRGPGAAARVFVAAEPARSGVHSRSLIVAGRRFAFWEGGAGTAIVMLHGFGADKDHWTRAARHLRHRFRLIALDLPGFGGTPAEPEEPVDVRSQAGRES